MPPWSPRTRTRKTRRGPGSAFGFHPLLGYVDHGATDHHGAVNHGGVNHGGGEPVAELLRPGRAGSNTAADHVTVLNAALAQLPAALRIPDANGRIKVLVRTDAAGATREFAAHLHRTGVEFSVGASFAHLDIGPALALLPKAAWTPAYQARKPRAAETGVQIEPRDGAWVTEATGCVDLSGWPPGTRLILRKERPHPGGAVAHHRHRRSAGHRFPHQHHPRRRGPPARRPRAPPPPPRPGRGPDPRGEDTGLRNLPFHDMAQNRIWVAISALAQDLLAWCARLALPAPAASYEPKRLRLRIFAVAGRLDRSARRRVLHIDPAWPWADTVTTAHARLAALPVP